MNNNGGFDFVSPRASSAKRSSSSSSASEAKVSNEESTDETLSSSLSDIMKSETKLFKIKCVKQVFKLHDIDYQRGNKWRGQIGIMYLN